MTARPSDRFIPWYIVIFFVAQAGLYAWFVSIAHRTYPGMVTEKAYDKGLRYNEVIAQTKLQEKLGWSSVITASFGGDGKAHISVALADNAARPLSGAKAALWLIRPVQDGMDIRLEMKPAENGVYTAATALPVRGLWEARIRMEKDGDRYQASKRVEF